MLTRSKFRYFETKEYAFAIPIPGTDGRKSQPAKTHIPVNMLQSKLLSANIKWIFKKPELTHE